MTPMVFGVVRQIDKAYHHFISPTASGSGNGSLEDPWTLTQFLAGGLGVNPGERTAMRCLPGAELYEQSGSFTWSSSLNGAAGQAMDMGKKINLVAYKPDGGLPTISSSGTANETTLRIDGTHCCMYGLRVRKNNTIRGNGRGTALWLRGAFDNKPTGSGLVAHCYIEDGANGIFTGNSAATDFQGGDWTCYGCVLINNGEDDGPRNHNFYTRHQGAGRWRIVKCITGMTLGNSLMVYEENASVNAIDNVDLIENICFQAGVLGTQTGNFWNIVIGGGGVVADGILKDCYIRGNILFFSGNDLEMASFQLGSESGTGEYTVVEDNHVYGGQQDDIMRVRTFRTDGNPTLVFRNNHFYPGAERIVWTQQSGDLSTWTWTNNKYYVASSGQVRFVHGGVNRTLAQFVSNAGIGGTDSEVAVPTTNQIHVIPVNDFEPGRAHLAIRNWESLSSVNVNLDAVLSTGHGYRIHRAQDPHGSAVASGTYTTGTPVSVPMNTTGVQAPIGTCPRTAPTLESGGFGAFLVTRT